MRFLWAILLLFGAVALFGQVWAENRTRENLTDAEVLTRHQDAIAVRAAQDRQAEDDLQIEKAHGLDDHHQVDIYEDYVLVTYKDGD